MVGILTVLKVCLKLSTNMIGVGRKDMIISRNKLVEFFLLSKKTMTLQLGRD